MCVPSNYSRIVNNFTRDDPRRFQFHKLTEKEGGVVRRPLRSGASTPRMNELLIQNLLLDRYQTQYLGLLRKITLPFADIYPASSMKGRQGRYAELSSKPCSYSNNLANGKVSSPIKLKIQNAINKALQGETEDSGVIVVGGRRRNRKRRPNKPKPTKNNTQPKKNKKNKKNNGGSSSDSSDKENGHSFNIYAVITKATSAGRKKDDQKPLIGSEWRPLDGKEFDDRDGDSGFWTPDTENDDTQETDTMPFGFGKKKKNESLIEKDVSPLPQPSKEVESAAVTITEKIEDVVAFSAEDAVADQTEQVAVTMTETVVEEQAVVEVVTSDAADGGAEQLVEIEQMADVQVEREIDEMGENIEKDSKIQEVATIMEEKDEAIMEDIDMTDESELIDQFAQEDKEMELVFGHNTVDLDIAYEVMSVDLNELEDDEEVAILDRFEMLGQTDGQVEGGKDEMVENSEKDSKTEEVTTETKEVTEVTAETKVVSAETEEVTSTVTAETEVTVKTAEVIAETEEKDKSTKEEVVTTERTEVTVPVADKETELIVSGDNATDPVAVTNEATSVEQNKMEEDEEPVEPAPVEIVEEKNVVETPVPVVEKQPKKQPRVESTPLIGKSTKVKDTQPGFLCCTIL